MSRENIAIVIHCNVRLLFPVFREAFALATLKIALNGWKLTILLLLVTGLGAVNLCTRPPPPAFGH